MTRRLDPQPARQASRITTRSWNVEPRSLRDPRSGRKTTLASDQVDLAIKDTFLCEHSGEARIDAGPAQLLPPAAEEAERVVPVAAEVSKDSSDSAETGAACKLRNDTVRYRGIERRVRSTIVARRLR